jgi:hypothetical protein
MATQKSNVIKFPQPIYLERKEDDGMIMNGGLRLDLAAAEARILAGDAGASGGAEFLCLSIRRRFRDRDAVMSDAIAKYYCELCAHAAALDF